MDICDELLCMSPHWATLCKADSGCLQFLPVASYRLAVVNQNIYSVVSLLPTWKLGWAQRIRDTHTSESGSAAACGAAASWISFRELIKAALSPWLSCCQTHYINGQSFKKRSQVKKQSCFTWWMFVSLNFPWQGKFNFDLFGVFFLHVFYLLLCQLLMVIRSTK